MQIEYILGKQIERNKIEYIGNKQIEYIREEELTSDDVDRGASQLRVGRPTRVATTVLLTHLVKVDIIFIYIVLFWKMTNDDRPNPSPSFLNKYILPGILFLQRGGAALLQYYFYPLK